jgi:hypothetical protein
LTAEKDGYGKLTIKVNVVKKKNEVGDLTMTTSGNSGSAASVSGIHKAQFGSTHQ